MKKKKKKTAGQRWLAKRMENPTFAADFKEARAEIDAVDGFIRMLDERRTAIGLSKGELARRVSQNPSALRRLLTSGGNPSMKTMVEIAAAVGMVLKFEVEEPAAKATPKAPKVAEQKKSSKTSKTELLATKPTASKSGSSKPDRKHATA
ncbi:MAG: helix-turn-helix domain-containing protein [Deltaproteobacteria bacterium]|nr:helix-turn-helix domain-containing protein [Deltaproteobacteria bacterium]